MPFDAHKNFAYSTVATAPSPAVSGLSLVVAAGDGAKYPAVPFNATVWPAGAQPTTANSEIVRVTNIATDTLTILRARESSVARTILVGDQIAATITAKTATDIEAMFSPDLALSALAPNTPNVLQLIPAASCALVISDYEIPLIIEQSTGDDDYVPLDEPTHYNAQSFMASATFLLDEIQLLLGSGGAPADNLILEIRSDSAGIPSSTILATVTISAASVPAPTAFYGFKLAAALNISQDVPYWLVVRRSGAFDGVNKLTWHFLTTGTYANGRASDSFNSGATWDTFIRAYDCGFRAIQYGVTEIGVGASLEIS